MKQQQSVHPTAIVAPGTVLGEGVVVSPFAIIEDDVEVGDHTYIASHAVLHSGTRIGKHCKIGTGACIATRGQQQTATPQHIFSYIGDHTHIFPYVTVSCNTKVGAYCWLMAYTHLGYNSLIEEHVTITNASQIGGHVVIEKYATLSGLVGVHQYSKIGRYAMVGGNAKVIKDIPPYALSAMHLGYNCFYGLNLVGLRRNNIPQAKIDLIKQVYTLLYQGGTSSNHTIAAVLAQTPASDVRDHIISFVTASKRGILPTPERKHG